MSVEVVLDRVESRKLIRVIIDEELKVMRFKKRVSSSSKVGKAARQDMIIDK